jgi:hypothetical protein
MLSRLGYVLPDNAVRARWIRLGADKRSEIMVIHVESMDGAADPAMTDARRVIERARSAFRLLPDPGAPPRSERYEVEKALGIGIAIEHDACGKLSPR